MRNFRQLIRRIIAAVVCALSLSSACLNPVCFADMDTLVTDISKSFNAANTVSGFTMDLVLSDDVFEEDEYVYYIQLNGEVLGSLSFSHEDNGTDEKINEPEFLNKIFFNLFPFDSDNSEESTMVMSIYCRLVAAIMCTLSDDISMDDAYSTAVENLVIALCNVETSEQTFIHNNYTCCEKTWDVDYYGRLLYFEVRFSNDISSITGNNDNVTPAYANSAKEDYSDSNSNDPICNEVMVKAISDAEIGDYIIFGSYEQDNDLTNGAEEIEWLVLDEKNGNLLIISRYALDMQPYDSRESKGSWRSCALRRWLNETFINEAFTSEEQSVILNVTVPAVADWEGKTDNNTVDKVFLLSQNEIEDYFASLGQKRECLATDYTYNKSPYTKGDCLWWARTNATTSALGCAEATREDSIGSDSYIWDIIDIDDAYGVRPALWISQSKL